MEQTDKHSEQKLAYIHVNDRELQKYQSVLCFSQKQMGMHFGILVHEAKK